MRSQTVGEADALLRAGAIASLSRQRSGLGGWLGGWLAGRGVSFTQLLHRVRLRGGLFFVNWLHERGGLGRAVSAGAL